MDRFGPGSPPWELSELIEEKIAKMTSYTPTEVLDWLDEVLRDRESVLTRISEV